MTDPAPSILDAHVHLWDTSRFDLPWLADAPGLATQYAAGNLSAAIGSLPVRTAVVVQAGESAAEAAWLLGTGTGAAGALPTRVILQYAPSRDGWLGAVSGAAAGGLAQVAGIRIPLQQLSPDWTGLEGLDALLTGLEDRGLVLELLLRPDQLTVVDDVAARHPRLKIVLCHLGLSAREPTPEWRATLARLSRRATISAKISGLFSLPGIAPADDSRAQDAVTEALGSLGPNRLMFGSDWPMSTRIGTYSEVVERTRWLLPEMTADESAEIWGGTAERVYGAARDH